MLVAIAASLAVNGFAEDRPNLLLITADDLGTQLSCYGDPIVQTPHLDRLADASVRFRTAYVTQASCSPSRSSMFTGLYPHGNGQYGLLNADVGFRVHERLVSKLLPNVLKRAGYRTAIFGKLHVGPESGFDFDVRSGEGFGNRDIRRQLDLARKFLDDSGDRPWFMMFNLFDPHVSRRRLPGGKRGPQYFPDVVKGLPRAVITSAEVEPWPWQGIDTPEQREKIAGYYNCVQRVDAAVGMLMRTLKETDNHDNTVIVFLGDHGPPFTRGKTSCYETGLRVPFIVSWPGVSQPHVSDRLVSSVDIYPTLLDAAHLELPAELHGRSLRLVLNEPRSGSNADVDWRRTLVAEFHFHGASPFFPRRAITDGRYKLIHNLVAGSRLASPSIDGDNAYAVAQQRPVGDPVRIAMQRLHDPPEWELYDLQNDPIEFRNRAGEASLAEVQKALVQSLADWQSRTSDPFRDPDFRRSIEAKYAKPD